MTVAFILIGVGAGGDRPHHERFWRVDLHFPYGYNKFASATANIHMESLGILEFSLSREIDILANSVQELKYDIKARFDARTQSVTPFQGFATFSLGSRNMLSVRRTKKSITYHWFLIEKFGVLRAILMPVLAFLLTPCLSFFYFVLCRIMSKLFVFDVCKCLYNNLFLPHQVASDIFQWGWNHIKTVINHDTKHCLGWRSVFF
jgi:hypothetical protein